MKKMVGFIGLAFFAPPRLAGATPTSRLYALPDLSREVYEEYLLAREVPERLAPSSGEPSLPQRARRVRSPSSPS